MIFKLVDTEANYLFKENIPFKKGYVIKRNKHEVTKIVPFVMMENTGTENYLRMILRFKKIAFFHCMNFR